MARLAFLVGLPMALVLTLVTVLLYPLTVLASGGTMRIEALRSFLLPPEDCPSPCWYGIQPGLTEVGEALNRLNEAPFGGEVRSVSFISRLDGVIVYEMPEGRVELSIDAGIVQSIALVDVASLGDIWFLLDRPERGYWLIARGPSRNSYEMALNQYTQYEELGLYVYSASACPTGLETMWEANALVRIGRPIYSSVTTGLIVEASGSEIYDLPDVLRRQRICRGHS